MTPRRRSAGPGRKREAVTINLIRTTRLDSIRLDESFFTPEGFFIDTPKVTRTGIFEYKNPDGSIRRELRLPQHVFDGDSLSTYEGKPVIITHTAGRVDKDNVEDEIVGTILSKGYKDGGDVRAKVVIHKIDSVKHSGLRELSLGYDLVLDETPGEWRGKPYDAIQTKIKVNHLALVHDARAGEQARLNLDGRANQNPEGADKMGAKRQTVNTQEPAVELEKEDGCRTDAAGDKGGGNDGASDLSPEDKIKAIKDKWDARRGDTAPPPDGKGGIDIIKAQDADIGELLSLVECLQAKSDFDAATKDSGGRKDADDEGLAAMKVKDNLDASEVNRIITERLSLARLGDRLNLDGLESINPLEAKKAIIAAVTPAMKLDGKGDAYVQAAFDLAVDQLNSRKDIEYQKRQMSLRMDGAALPDDKPGALSARQAMTERMINGGSN